MMEKRASETDNIHAHLDHMALSYEHLSSMGAAIHNEDYASMILMSLPDSYTTHLETLADAAISSGHTFTAHDIIAKAIELADKRQVRAGRDSKSNPKNSTFQTVESHAKGKKGALPKKNIECFNCHKKGHYAHDCRGPGGAKEGQQPPRARSSKGNDNAANTAASMPDGAWSAVALGPAEVPAPSPIPLPINDETDVYLDELPELPEPPELPDSTPTLREPLGAAHMADNTTPAGRTTSELYDSGATRHMTPYRTALTNYTAILPMPINAANQHTFCTIGQGDLPIHVPNGNGFTKITLRDVLHTPDIALTLVSVSLIDQAGYTVTFKGGTCTIHDQTHKLIGCFPKRDGLYKVDTQHPESASACTM